MSIKQGPLRNFTFFVLSFFKSGSFCQIYRVTDEALIAETMVWPNTFLMNVFFALKGSKLFIIICLDYFISVSLCDLLSNVETVFVLCQLLSHKIY